MVVILMCITELMRHVPYAERVTLFNYRPFSITLISKTTQFVSCIINMIAQRNAL